MSWKEKPRDRELLEAFASSVGDPVVDVGSGPGQVGAFVRQCGRVVIGVDLSPEMAKLSRRRLDAAVTADMRALPLGSGQVAAVFAFYSLIHVPQIEVPACFGSSTASSDPAAACLSRPMKARERSRQPSS